MSLQIGQVFEKKIPLPQLPGLDIEWDIVNVRILMLDQQYVYYEKFSFHNRLGGFTEKMQGKVVYYRIQGNFFVENSTYLENIPLTDDERIVIRPDLPINLVNSELNFKWSSKKIENIDLFVENIDKDFYELNKLNRIYSSKLIIYPFGKRYGLGKPVIIEATNKTSFDPIELLWKLNNIQATNINEEMFPFLGVYRLGHEKSLPTYAIQR